MTGKCQVLKHVQYKELKGEQKKKNDTKLVVSKDLQCVA
jgi:hypothetical protein